MQRRALWGHNTRHTSPSCLRGDQLCFGTAIVGGSAWMSWGCAIISWEGDPTELVSASLEEPIPSHMLQKRVF